MSDNRSNTFAGAKLFAVVSLLLSVFLLSQIGSQAKFSASGNLTAQPAFWPGISLGLMVLFGVGHVVSVWRGGHQNSDDQTAARIDAGLIGEGFRLVECFIWFMVYVAFVPVTGYLLTTLVFSLLFARRSGYRTPRMLLASIIMGLVVVLVFKTFLGVKIPGGAIYEFLPAALRNFMITRF